MNKVLLLIAWIFGFPTIIAFLNIPYFWLMEKWMGDKTGKPDQSFLIYVIIYVSGILFIAWK